MKTNCKECEYKNICKINDYQKYEKLFRGKCYVDDLCDKLNLKPETVIKRVLHFKDRFNGVFHLPGIDTGKINRQCDGHRIYIHNVYRDITRDEWIALPPKEKEEMVLMTDQGEMSHEME